MTLRPMARPYSCCGTGLYQNGWNGVSFWDCEMWHEPSLLLLQPSIAKSMRQFRANNLAGLDEGIPSFCLLHSGLHGESL